MSDLELLTEHVARFNAGVRSGDFEPMLERFTEDAQLEFEGVPVGPFEGLEAIRTAYREQPPDDEIDIADPFQTGSTVAAAYSWRRDNGRLAGELRLTIDGGRVTRMVVTFDAPPG